MLSLLKMWFFSKKQATAEDLTLPERVRKLESRLLIIESDLIQVLSQQDTIKKHVLKRLGRPTDEEKAQNGKAQDLYSQVLLPI